MGFLGGLLPVAGALIGALGGGKKSKPAQSQSISGWQALPPEVQKTYLNTYLPGVQDFAKTPFSPEALSVYDTYKSGLGGLMEDIPEYLKFFQQNVGDPTYNKIQEQADIERNRLNASAVNSGLGGLFNSNLGVQLSQLQKNADDRKAEYAYRTNQDNLTNALGLRSQTLQELLNSQNAQYDKLGQLAGLLGAFPGGSTQTSIGPSGGGPNTWDRIGGALTAFGGLFG